MFMDTDMKLTFIIWLCLAVATNLTVANDVSNQNSFGFQEDMIIATLSQEFNIRNIVFVGKKLQDTRSWLRSKSNNMTIRHIYDIAIPNEVQLIEENVGFALSDNSSRILEELLSTPQGYLLAVSTTWFLMGSSQLVNKTQRDLQDSIRVNQKIFFVDVEQGHVTEAYKVVEQRVLNYVGNLMWFNGRVEYLPTEKRNWLQRHSNLMGQELHGLTIDQPPYLIIPLQKKLKNSNSSDMVTHKGSRFKDVTNEIIFGLFKDVIKYLEVSLNFTTRFFLSQEKHSHPFGAKINGSWSGMIGHIIDGVGDFIATSLTQSIRRFEVLKFVQPIGAETQALYVPYKGYDVREWLAFLYPLAADLWMLLMFNAVLILLVFKALEFYYFGTKLFWQKVNVVGDYWMLFTSYFGKAPEKKFTHKQEAIRVLLLAVYLLGNLVFMSYKASLTAALSVQKISLPFETIEQLLDSDIKVISPKFIHSYLANFYNLEAREGTSELSRVYFEKILKYPNAEYLSSIHGSLRHLVTTEEPSTFLCMKEIMPFLGDDVCKTTLAYEFSFPAKVSLALAKNSPYHEIFNYGLLKIMESGFLETTIKKHFDNSDNCKNDGEPEDRKDKSLGLVKLTSLFAIMASGVVLSALTLILEAVNVTIKKVPGRLIRDNEAGNASTFKPRNSEAQERSEEEFNILMLKWGISDRGSFRTEMKELLFRNPTFFE